MICRLHKHSSDKSAQKCAIKEFQRKEARKHRLGLMNTQRPAYVKHAPAKQVQLGSIKFLVFYGEP